MDDLAERKKRMNELAERKEMNHGRSKGKKRMNELAKRKEMNHGRSKGKKRKMDDLAERIGKNDG